MLVDLIIHFMSTAITCIFDCYVAGNFEFFKLSTQFIWMLGVVACLLVRGIGSFLE